MQLSTKIGRFYGVGVGPGDPELLTLKAYRVLTTVPVIFAPRKSGGSESLAHTIINKVTKPEQKVVELDFPMLRDKAQLAESWRQAADTIWQHLSTGQDAAFINLGDPLLYGTFSHLLEALRQDHPQVAVEVIPGISSLHAATARGIVPLATDNERVAIISLPCEDGFIRRTLEDFDTVVFMKINRTFDRLLNILEELDLTQKCLYARRCTTEDEELVRDVRQLKGQKPDYFSLLIVRK